MDRRKIILGTYDTDLNGPWTLAEWTLSPAVYRSEMITVPGRDGDLDASTILTDGEPRYESRTLTARFERSDGTRLEREAAINIMINWLDGWQQDIILPDDEGHYIRGRLHVEKEYNDTAHAAVNVSATCDPWRYNKNETVLAFTASATAQSGRLTNNGRRTVVPLIEVSGDGASVNLVHGTASWALGPGSYQLPDLIVRQGGADITYSGTGVISFTYREAVL